jgi:hypothetical protein
LEAKDLATGIESDLNPNPVTHHGRVHTYEPLEAVLSDSTYQALNFLSNIAEKATLLAELALLLNEPKQAKLFDATVKLTMEVPSWEDRCRVYRTLLANPPNRLRPELSSLYLAAILKVSDPSFRARNLLTGMRRVAKIELSNAARILLSSISAIESDEKRFVSFKKSMQVLPAEFHQQAVDGVLSTVNRSSNALVNIMGLLKIFDSLPSIERSMAIKKLLSHVRALPSSYKKAGLTLKLASKMSKDYVEEAYDAAVGAFRECF